MTKLKDFIDFTLTLVEMEEVKGGKFPLPKEMVFELTKINHDLVQRELHEEKGSGNYEPKDVFELEVFGVNYKFIKK
jgi:hypothetical protein